MTADVVLDQQHERDLDLVTIRTFGDIAEAFLAQGRLQAAGIECFLADARMATLDWPVTRGIRLQVGQGDAEEAFRVLDDPAAADELEAADESTA